ncbi:MAG: hypothetical protein RIC55_03760 [Pirellulaceae bacterium]
MADEQDSRSLIGQEQIRQEQVLRRIKELSDLEDHLGFVYVGEKRWLADRLAGDAERSYGDWVLRQLDEFVFPGGLERRDSGIGLGECWTGYTEDTNLIWRPPELAGSIIKVRYLRLWMPARSAAPEEPQLCQAFEALHDLAYYLRDAELLYEHLYEELTLSSIIIDDKREWHLSLLNDYGSVGGAMFVGREVQPLRE